jgi:uncharacterized protein YjbJ (UPF0337 family)
VGGTVEWRPQRFTRRENTMMKQSSKDKVEASLHDVKGTIKRNAGKLTNAPDLEAAGVVEKTVRKIQVGQAEKAVETP